MTIEERLTKRIVDLKKEMADFIGNAEKQIVAYQAAIAELEMLAAPETVAVEQPKA